MCGVAGSVYFQQVSKENIASDLNKMLEHIEHRGPDAHGVWVHGNNQVGFGHSRLSILDLSEAGSQPMRSHSDRFCISYNGEIYNHLKLRKELNHNINWQGTSDTETLLNCIDCWGLDKTLQKVRGMFAFALWDESEQKIYLCRDRFGEKPLYYGWNSSEKKQLLFSSELSALSSVTGFSQEVNLLGVSRFIKTNNFGGESTVYNNIFKVLPGHFLTLDLESSSIKLKQYWSSYQEAEISKRKPFLGTFDEATNELDSLLRGVVSDQMLSDVPLGCFLSGGLDSSLIASIMSAVSDTPINTFSIGHYGESNEAERAKLIAQSLGANHTELYVDSDTALELVPEIFNIYSEPFADSSQIPTYLVSKLAKEQVTVVLSGDAGDEIFGGYNRYEYAHRFWPKINSLPNRLKSIISKLAPQLTPLILLGSRVTGAINKWENLDLKIQKTLKTMECASVYELHDLLLAPDHRLINSELYHSLPEERAHEVFSNNLFEAYEQMMIADTETYLADDILVKVDRAAMRHSLETRVPYLDNRIFSFAWSLPSQFKIHNGGTKRLLRALVSRYIDPGLLDQPKTGFGIPVAEWLRGPLKNYASDVLFSGAMNSLEIFDQNEILTLWNRHISCVEDNSSQLWSLISLGVWLKENTSET